MIILIVSSIIIFNNISKHKKQTTTSKTKNHLVTKKVEKEQTEQTETMYKVDIKGEVNNPGIYSLSSNSRIIDVIEKANGLTENANTTVVNLSKKIKDEMVIIIYSNSEVADFEKTKEKEKLVQSKCIQKNENSLTNDACINEENTTTKEQSKISLNNASLEELTTLPGIGEAKAKDIISYRTEKGGFKTIEELTQISGIGENIFAKIKDYITL